MAIAEVFVLTYGSGLYGENLYSAPEQQDVETTSTKKMLTPLPPPIFSGMKLKGDIRIGSLVLNQTDENNVIWVCTDLQGWWDLPEPQMVDIPRGWGDGSYDTSGRFAARDITLNGVIFPPKPEYLPAARQTLLETINLVRRGAWLMTRENPTRASWVRLSGRPSVETVNARGRTEFSIGLRAADPIKYSWNDDDVVYGRETTEFYCKNVSLGRTGTAVINNIGNTDVTVKLEITGPMSAPARVVNETTSQAINIVKPLSGNWTGTIYQSAVTTTNTTAYVATTLPHNIVSGDSVVITSTSTYFSNGTYTASAGTSGYFVFFDIPEYVGGPPFFQSTTGTVVKTDANEILDIDTYNKEVAVDGLFEGARARVDAVVDWITLQPGNNTIRFEQLLPDGSATVDGVAYIRVFYRSGWIG